MFAYVLVKYEDIEHIDINTGGVEFHTTTEIISTFSDKKEAEMESSYLNSNNDCDNILYDVIKTVLY